MIYYYCTYISANTEGDDVLRSKTDRIICGTCEFWTGNRMPVFDPKGIPKVDIIDDIGQCENQNSRFTDEIRNKDRNCINYSKWTELL